jgi:DNA-binding NarL/FixJ family response regulator
MGGKIITVIDQSAFLRECVRRSLQSAFNFRVLTYSDINNFHENKTAHESSVIIFSYGHNIGKDDFANGLTKLLEIEPNTSVIVLGSRLDLVDAAIRAGVKGYIPVTLEFQVVLEAVRVVLAGGTYVPLDCLPMPAPVEHSQTSVTLTSREVSVIRAIKLGKSNKIIAYNLGMTENTVKVHVRHIMSKLKVRNRTEIAMMSDRYIFQDN